MESFLVAEMGFEPHDLRVMSPTSCQTAPLRDIMVPEAGVEPVRDKISRDFKSRASANSAIPASMRPWFPSHCLNIIALCPAKVNTFLGFSQKFLFRALTFPSKYAIIYFALLYCMPFLKGLCTAGRCDFTLLENRKVTNTSGIFN